jgi:hypothetical protein
MIASTEMVVKVMARMIVHAWWLTGCLCLCVQWSLMKRCIESSLEIKLGILRDGWLNAETYDINMPCVMCSQTCLVDGLQCCISVS